MAQHEFQYCCGIAEVGGLGDCYGDAMETLEAGIRAAVRSNKGAVIATTADQPEAEKALRAGKWKRIRRFHNPNSGNEVSLWFKNISKMHKKDDDEIL